MKKLIHLLVLSCKKATFLIEKSQAKPLGFIDRMQLSIHLKLCDGCLRYQKQSLFIEGLLKMDQKDLSTLSGLTLSDKSKELIQRTIEENLRKK